MPSAGRAASDGLAGALQRRLLELSGIALLLLSLIAALALASWSALDPSFNLASDGPTRNLFGRPGAVFADFLLQLGVWAWRLLTHRPLIRVRIRLIAWFLSVVFAAGFAACIRSTFNWP